MTNNLVQSTIQLKDENKNWQIVLQSFIHFPPQNKLYNHFNRTNVKISYSCMPNMNSYIYTHHHKVLNDKPKETQIDNCSCRNKDTCPPPNSFQTKSIIFKTNIDCDIAGYKRKCYLGLCETTFKEYVGNHKSYSTTANTKLIQNYQTNFGKSKKATKHQILPNLFL